MRIAFDVSILSCPEPTGVERTFASLLRALARRRTGHEFLLVSPGEVPEIPGLSAEFSPSPLEAEGGPLWRERLLPAMVRERGVELFHSPLSAFPLLAPCRKIATVHEIPWLEEGTRGDEGRRPPHRLWAYLAASFADRILCVSKRTAENLERLHPSAAARIRAFPHGLDPIFRPVPHRDGQLEAYGIPSRPYFLCVGKARAKKNLLEAVRAFRVFLDRTGAPHRLVLAGPGGPALDQAREKARALAIADRVLTPGYVAEKDLPALYGRAEALLYLSFSEGFGLPPLEAMACGTPVIASDRGAIPEVLGEGGILLPPGDPMRVAEAMARLASDPAFRAAKVEEGRRRAGLFRWEDTVSRLLSIYGELGP